MPPFPLPYQDDKLIIVYSARASLFLDAYDYNGELLEVQEIKKKEPGVWLPLWYWKKVVRFAVDVKGVETDLNGNLSEK